jgi:predicted amidohydrolase YtcJ
MSPYRSCLVLALLVTLGACAPKDPAPTTQEPLTVFVAREIITMQADQPDATWVAVQKGRILALDNGAPPKTLNGRKTTLDNRFANKVLMPGFIDPHLHPMIAAVLLPTHFITPEDWDLPRGFSKGVTSRKAYLDTLQAALNDAPADQPFITWGWHTLWHGPITRDLLDEMDDTKPVFVWQRSFHELVANSKGMAYLGVPDRAAFDTLINQPGIDPAHANFKNGYFSETALAAAFRKLAPAVMSPEHLSAGLREMNTMLLRAGVTTIADMATGIFGPFAMEAGIIEKTYSREGVPVRVMLMPYASETSHRAGSLRDAPALIFEDEKRYSSTKILMENRVKLLADGAFFVPAMKLKTPAYLDGRQGKWITEPKMLARQAQTFWDAGLSLHIHVNGDGGLDAVLDVLSTLPRDGDHTNQSIVLEHLGISREDQIARIADLGLLVSAQPNYLYVVSGKYSEQLLDKTQAEEMVRLGSLERAGIPFALHSDMTMAPAQPLFLAWIAVNRINMDGQLMAPKQRISVDAAMRAITINAARMIGLEGEVGSIVPGKKADFAVLDENPYRVTPMHLKDIHVDGVVFEGKWFDAQKKAGPAH